MALYQLRSSLTRIKLIYWAIFSQDRLNESKLDIDIKIINYVILWINNQGIKQNKQSSNPNINQGLLHLLAI